MPMEVNCHTCGVPVDIVDNPECCRGPHCEPTLFIQCPDCIEYYAEVQHEMDTQPKHWTKD